jgi:hypothetical protein
MSFYNSGLGTIKYCYSVTNKKPASLSEDAGFLLSKIPIAYFVLF